LKAEINEAKKRGTLEAKRSRLADNIEALTKLVIKLAERKEAALDPLAEIASRAELRSVRCAAALQLANLLPKHSIPEDQLVSVALTAKDLIASKNADERGTGYSLAWRSKQLRPELERYLYGQVADFLDVFAKSKNPFVKTSTADFVSDYVKRIGLEKELSRGLVLEWLSLIDSAKDLQTKRIGLEAIVKVLPPISTASDETRKKLELVYFKAFDTAWSSLDPKSEFARDKRLQDSAVLIFSELSREVRDKLLSEKTTPALFARIMENPRHPQYGIAQQVLKDVLSARVRGPPLKHFVDFKIGLLAFLTKPKLTKELGGDIAQDLRYLKNLARTSKDYRISYLTQFVDHVKLLEASAVKAQKDQASTEAIKVLQQTALGVYKPERQYVGPASNEFLDLLAKKMSSGDPQGQAYALSIAERLPEKQKKLELSPAMLKLVENEKAFVKARVRAAGLLCELKELRSKLFFELLWQSFADLASKPIEGDKNQELRKKLTTSLTAFLKASPLLIQEEKWRDKFQAAALAGVEHPAATKKAYRLGEEIGEALKRLPIAWEVPEKFSGLPQEPRRPGWLKKMLSLGVSGKTYRRARKDYLDKLTARQTVLRLTKEKSIKENELRGKEVDLWLSTLNKKMIEARSRNAFSEMKASLTELRNRIGPPTPTPIEEAKPEEVPPKPPEINEKLELLARRLPGNIRELGPGSAKLHRAATEHQIVDFKRRYVEYVSAVRRARTELDPDFKKQVRAVFNAIKKYEKGGQTA